MNEKKKQEKQSGQTLIEFVLLLVVVISLSMLLLRGVNGAVGERWKTIVEIISEAPGIALN